MIKVSKSSYYKFFQGVIHVIALLIKVNFLENVLLTSGLCYKSAINKQIIILAYILRKNRFFYDIYKLRYLTHISGILKRYVSFLNNFIIASSPPHALLTSFGSSILQCFVTEFC